jgi:Fe-S cluster biogenesis protein NfuA
MMKEDVQKVIEKIRPYLQRDGGDVELVQVNDDKTVHVRLQGACHGCPGAQMTLKSGIERTLREEIDPAITVIAVD